MHGKWHLFVPSLSIREKELGHIRQKVIIGAVSSVLWTFTPILVSIQKES